MEEKPEYLKDCEKILWNILNGPKSDYLKELQKTLIDIEKEEKNGKD